MSKSEVKIARQSQRKRYRIYTNTEQVYIEQIKGPQLFIFIDYRLRIAQEIQRKLEELDVKLKTLEAEGVEVEKKLRGEGNKLQLFFYI